ncbi:aminoglycoside adenylyltransferase [Edwardsiella hoshinae]|uniref:Acetyltransferase (GNAT) family n=1 Tax=Edwardsiella hoshinae TaxID=93378 RepID=A0A376D7N7_9GAMM|nr:GNAT family N-acetyltransferase [Edwardsiella hoshinae]AOV95894.1 aminoglycoside adenylyltransferase [Edwardsiella hoshinae]QPR28283.1 GNAT family N-acetyltransferase [Edwardsiella hoshinae]STC84094.1 Acetyltransferase (GNAT) family [Edwardsiella hoshinae]
MTIVALDETMMRLWVGLRAQLAPQTPLSQHWLDGCALLDAAPFMGFLALGPQGEGLGFIELALQPDSLHRHAPVSLRLGCLFVRPERRQQGVATELVAVACAWGRQHGCAEMVSAVPLADQGQQQMHRALGFTQGERWVDYRLSLD